MLYAQLASFLGHGSHPVQREDVLKEGFGASGSLVAPYKVGDSATEEMSEENTENGLIDMLNAH
jgi:hypothetical protein